MQSMHSIQRKFEVQRKVPIATEYTRENFSKALQILKCNISGSY
jgi:hypothetical protein